jgi:hypothetical protein
MCWVFRRAICFPHQLPLGPVREIAPSPWQQRSRLNYAALLLTLQERKHEDRSFSTQPLAISNHSARMDLPTF